MSSFSTEQVFQTWWHDRWKEYFFLFWNLFLLFKKLVIASLIFYSFFGYAECDDVTRFKPNLFQLLFQKDQEIFIHFNFVLTLKNGFLRGWVIDTAKTCNIWPPWLLFHLRSGSFFSYKSHRNEKWARLVLDQGLSTKANVAIRITKDVRSCRRKGAYIIKLRTHNSMVCG